MNKISIPKMGRIISVSMLIFWIISAPLIWILRDGFGPDAVDSVGWPAIERALMTFYWGPVLILLIILNLILIKTGDKLNADRDE